MKNLENVVGLQEMNLQEMKDTNGGYGLVDLIITCVKNAPKAIAAAVEVRGEGGTTCADMPFK